MKLEDLRGKQFDLEQQLATGGMGEVFRARDLSSGEPVAIKVIAEERGPLRARFARDVELLSALSHRGIVRYLSHGETPAGGLFLVMEWLDGEDLKHRLARAPLTMSESVTLATRVAAALGAAHARGIVHRDLKPSNLFLPGGRIEHVKVLDFGFGIAQRAGQPQLTRTGVLVGTPGYLAPEQARTQGEVDARADVFALGCVLFQCLTGTPVFDGDDAAAILAKILFGEAPRVSDLWPEVPEDLDALVAQMLAKDPALRPCDGANLEAALAALGPRAHRAAVAPAGRPGKTVAITGGERRLLAVVLLGSVPKDAGRAPDEAALSRACEPYGGRMEQLADGSTIVVLEADRHAATDHAAQAARLALALRALADGRPMAIAMGRADSTSKLPEGDVIDRASRLLSHRAPLPGDLPRIALDEISAGLLDARFDVIETEAGLSLRGERALLRGARTLLGRPTSCVGRDWELAALTALLDECIDEPKAQVVVVTAEAGMGKSRLGAELVSRVRDRDDEVAIWVGRGDSLRAGSTLDLLAQALRGALGIHGAEPLPERRDKLRTRVAAHVPAGDQKRVTEFLGELVGTPFEVHGESSAALVAARQDAHLMSDQMRRAWLDFLAAETSAHPVLLLLEDLHWGDFGTVQLIDTALREHSRQPWMVLALARPEVFEVFPRLWAERQSFQEIRLKELSRKAAERLVRQVLGDRVGPETIERVVEQADGNAFYLEELIRAVAEGKDKALPETVLAMVETRLDRLSAEARRVLRAASVFGEVCWEGGVTVLLGGAMGATVVGEWLDQLVDQEVLAARHESRFPGERELAFRHALLREGAYATLTEEDKRLGHRLAGEWLERHGEADPMVLAGHLERGGEGARAASYYLRAAEQASLALDVNATVTSASLGLGCAPPEELRIALLGIRCEVSLHSVNLISTGYADAEELMRAAPRGSLPWAQGLSMYYQRLATTGRINELGVALGLLREVEPAPEAVGRMALAFILGLSVHDSSGRVLEGNALEARLREVVRPVLDRDPLARFWWNTARAIRAAHAHDDPWLGFKHSEENQALSGVLGGERFFLSTHLSRGFNLWCLGAYEAAEQALRGIAAADTMLGMGSSLRRLYLCGVCTDRGALDEARDLATQLREYAQAHHMATDEGRARWFLAEVLRRMGDLEGTDRELAAALGRTIPFEAPGVLATLSALRLAQGRAGEALAAAEDALARYTAMSGCGLFRGAFVRLAHAEALHATGAHEAARHAIAEARARLLAIAGKIAEPAYKRHFLEDVPENARTLALARAWLGEPPPPPSLAPSGPRPDPPPLNQG